MNVGIIDSGIDLQRLYDGRRHDYATKWIPIEQITFNTLVACDLVIIPTGTDNVLLHRFRDVLRAYLQGGGRICCLDGPAAGLFEGIQWFHTPTEHRSQVLRAPQGTSHCLLDGVTMEELACKDGVRGWWCEGELYGNGLIPLVVDQHHRTVAALLHDRSAGGLLFVTAAARLPAFSDKETFAPNRLFANFLAWVRTMPATPRQPIHLYVHSGNWAQQSFLASARFGQRFAGVHWSLLDDTALANVTSIWIPWESNTPALKRYWHVLERAVQAGATLVVEDLRDDWIPGVHWESRPVDSSWWREGRQLALVRQPGLAETFRQLAPSLYFWHYHGVFQSPPGARPLLAAPDGKDVLSLVPPSGARKGNILLSTLDATFEFGAGKIHETGDYIDAVLAFVV